MRTRYYYFLLLGLYAIIFFDILFIGRMIDALTLVVLFLIFLGARQSSKLDKIFFISAIIFLIFALFLYFVPISNKLYDVSANWVYAFLFAGALKMLAEEFKNEKHT